MILWYVCAGVLSGLYAYYAINNDIVGDVPPHTIQSSESFEFPVWYFPSGEFLTVALCIAVVGLFAQVSSIGIREYNATTSRSVEPIFPMALGYGYAIYGAVIVILPLLDQFFNRDVETFGGFIIQMAGILILGFLVFLPAIIILLVFTLVGLPAFPFLVLANAPYFFVGVYSFFAGTSKTSRVAERHVKTKRPNHAIEKELAGAMVSGMKSDDELRKIINELGPIRRFFHIMTYKKKAQKYREMREFMEAQREAMAEEAKMADTAHEFERDKRRYEQR